MRIADTWFVNFADAGARGLPGAATVWLYGERTGDAGLRALGAWAQSHREATAIHPQIASIQRCLQSLFLHQRIASEPVARTGGESDAWMPSIEVLTARETPTEGQGFFLAARGGHNAESHNHNDVGSFVVFHDGRPLLIDVGVEVYTRKTFSPQRYEIWTMRSLYHNLPEVGGAEQCPGAQYRATNVEARLDPAETALSLDIAAAYPPQAGIRRWRRTSRLLRGAAPAVEIVDDFTLAQPTTAVALHLMAPVAPDASEAGALRFGADAAGQPVRLAYPAGALACAVEPIDLTDPHLCRVWGDRVYRIRLTATSPIAAATWTVRLERIAG